MKYKSPSYPPVAGKTYSLFGNTENTRDYYKMIRSLVDELVVERYTLEALLNELRNSSARMKTLRKIISGNSENLIKQINSKQGSDFKKFTNGVGEHLRSLSLFEGRGSVIRTSEMQYHLYMLEIEVTNRLYIEKFKAAPYRFALLPHCLRDIWDNCKSEIDGADYVCRHCNQDCYLNHISRILKENKIKPYIWTTRNLKSLFREVASQHSDFAVLGIACIPELVMGMRRSTRKGIPAVGIPLNANCCVRWFGSYRENSVDLEELQKLIC